MFHELLVRLGDRISKKDTWDRKALDPGLKPGLHAVVPCHQHCSTLQIQLPGLLFPHPLLPGCIFVLLEALGVHNWIVPYPLDHVFFLLLCQIERSCLFLLPLLWLNVWLSVRQIQGGVLLPSHCLAGCVILLDWEED